MGEKRGGICDTFNNKNNFFFKLNVLKLHIVVRTNPGIQDNGFQHFAVEKS